MRRPSHAILALIMTLLVAREASAFASYPVRDLRVNLLGSRFGFVDMNPGWNGAMDNGARPFTLLSAGPLGEYKVGVSARTGTAIVLSFVILSPVGAFITWRRFRRTKDAGRGFEVRQAK